MFAPLYRQATLTALRQAMASGAPALDRAMANGVVLREWGLHLIDMPVAMGNLVELADAQAEAWRGVGLPTK